MFDAANMDVIANPPQLVYNSMTVELNNASTELHRS